VLCHAKIVTDTESSVIRTEVPCSRHPPRVYESCSRIPGSPLIAIRHACARHRRETLPFSASSTCAFCGPLPYQDGGTSGRFTPNRRRGNAPDVPFFSAGNLRLSRPQPHAPIVVEHHSMSFLLYTNDSAEPRSDSVVSAISSDVLGVRPLLGRTFVAAR